MDVLTPFLDTSQAQQEKSIPPGLDVDLADTLLSSDGSTVLLTDAYVIRLIAVSEDTGAVLFVKSSAKPDQVEFDPTQRGYFVVHIKAADTLGKTGRYVYSMIVDNADRRSIVSQGSLVVRIGADIPIVQPSGQGTPTPVPTQGQVRAWGVRDIVIDPNAIDEASAQQFITGTAPLDVDWNGLPLPTFKTLPVILIEPPTQQMKINIVRDPGTGSVGELIDGNVSFKVYIDPQGLRPEDGVFKCGFIFLQY